MRWIRFVVPDRDGDSGRRLGILNAALALADRGELTPSEVDTVGAIEQWFDAHLATPTKFTRKRNDSHRRPRALSWFKDTAFEHIQKMRELASLLEDKGVVVHTIVSERPGYVVYEDDFQVVAEPFVDSGA